MNLSRKSRALSARFIYKNKNNFAHKHEIYIGQTREWFARRDELGLVPQTPYRISLIFHILIMSYNFPGRCFALLELVAQTPFPISFLPTGPREVLQTMVEFAFVVWWDKSGVGTGVRSPMVWMISLHASTLRGAGEVQRRVVLIYKVWDSEA